MMNKKHLALLLMLTMLSGCQVTVKEKSAGDNDSTKQAVVQKSKKDNTQNPKKSAGDTVSNYTFAEERVLLFLEQQIYHGKYDPKKIKESQLLDPNHPIQLELSGRVHKMMDQIRDSYIAYSDEVYKQPLVAQGHAYASETAWEDYEQDLRTAVRDLNPSLNSGSPFEAGKLHQYFQEGYAVNREKTRVAYWSDVKEEDGDFWVGIVLEKGQEEQAVIVEYQSQLDLFRIYRIIDLDAVEE